MLGRVLVNMIIIPAVILTLLNGIVNKSFANEEKTKTEYVISQSEESKFLENIYKKETDTLWFIYGVQKYKESDNNNIVTEEKTIEEQAVEVLALDEKNKGYISIEKIGLDKAPIADGTYLKPIGKCVLNQTEDNRITLITCTENQRNLRQCIIGIKKTM